MGAINACKECSQPIDNNQQQIYKFPQKLQINQLEDLQSKQENDQFENVKLQQPNQIFVNDKIIHLSQRDQSFLSQNNSKFLQKIKLNQTDSQKIKEFFANIKYVEDEQKSFSQIFLQQSSDEVSVQTKGIEEYLNDMFLNNLTTPDHNLFLVIQQKVQEFNYYLQADSNIWYLDENKQNSKVYEIQMRNNKNQKLYKSEGIINSNQKEAFDFLFNNIAAQKYLQHQILDYNIVGERKKLGNYVVQQSVVTFKKDFLGSKSKIIIYQISFNGINGEKKIVMFDTEQLCYRGIKKMAIPNVIILLCQISKFILCGHAIYHQDNDFSSCRLVTLQAIDFNNCINEKKQKDFHLQIGQIPNNINNYL